MMSSGMTHRSELPPSRRVAWVGREWLWHVVRYQYCLGGVTMTVAARFLFRRSAQAVADAMCAAYFDGGSAAAAPAEDRVRAAIETRDFSNVSAAEVRAFCGRVMTSAPRPVPVQRHRGWL